MFRSTGWLGGMAAAALIAAFSGHPAAAQVCVEDQYGQVVCPGSPQRPRLATWSPSGREFGPPQPDRDYGPPPGREFCGPAFPRPRSATPS